MAHPEPSTPDAESSTTTKSELCLTYSAPTSFYLFRNILEGYFPKFILLEHPERIKTLQDETTQGRKLRELKADSSDTVPETEMVYHEPSAPDAESSITKKSEQRLTHSAPTSY